MVPAIVPRSHYFEGPLFQRLSLTVTRGRWSAWTDRTSFGVVSGVTGSPRHWCIRWDPRALRGRGGFWGRLPHRPNGFSGVFCNRNVLREKFIIFPYGQYTVGIYVSLAFRSFTQVRGRCWGLTAIGKHVTVDTRRTDVRLHGAAATSWQPLPTNFWWSCQK